MAVLGEQGSQRDTRRRGHPPAGPGGRLRGQSVPFEAAKGAFRVGLGELEPVREIGHIGRAQRDE